MLTRRITAVARRLRSEPEYTIDDALRTRDTLEMLASAGAKLLRGLLRRPFLGHVRGLLFVGRGAVIRNGGHVRAGRNLVIEDYAEVQGLSSEGIEFGDNVTVGRQAMIRPSGYYGRQIGIGLRVGDRSNIGAASYIGCSGGIIIGRDVLLSPHVQIYSENHVFTDSGVPIKAQGVVRKRVIVEDDCWLASGSIILAGVRIGRGSIVAAGAVVTSDVPSGVIVAGVPARVIGHRGGGA